MRILQKQYENYVTKLEFPLNPNEHYYLVDKQHGKTYKHYIATEDGKRAFVVGIAADSGITLDDVGNALSSEFTFDGNNISINSVSWNKITDAPTLFSGSYNDLTDKPVLFSGSWNDLTNKPNIPAAQVNSDWNASSGVAQILNKPILFSGSYADLSNKPTLFDGNYSSLSGKPVLFSGNYSDLQGKPTLFSGSYTDLTNKPTFKTINGESIVGVGDISISGDGGTVLNGTGFVVANGTSITYDSTVYEPQIIAKNTAFNKDFGITAGTVVQGNDSRVNNGQTAFSWGNHASVGYLTSLAHTHGVANAAGTQQFTFAVGESIKFEGTGNTAISFDTTTKKIIINSTAGAGISGLTAGYVPYATGATTIGNSGMFWDATNGRVGIGITIPKSLLDINRTSVGSTTYPTAPASPLKSTYTITATPSMNYRYATQNNLVYTNVGTFSGYQSAALNNQLRIDNSSIYQHTLGHVFSATNSVILVDHTSSATKLANLQVQTQVVNGSSVTDLYSIYISVAQTGNGGTITNLWGIYQESTVAKNYFAGKVLIGTITDAGYALDVNGTINTTGTITRTTVVDGNVILQAPGFSIKTITSNTTYNIDAVNKNLQISSRSGYMMITSDNTNNITIASGGNTIISKLAGAGTRMVVADATGVLSTQAIPSGGGSGETNTVSNLISPYAETGAIYSNKVGVDFKFRAISSPFDGGLYVDQETNDVILKNSGYEIYGQNTVYTANTEEITGKLFDVPDDSAGVITVTVTAHNANSIYTIVRSASFRRAAGATMLGAVITLKAGEIIGSPITVPVVRLEVDALVNKPILVVGGVSGVPFNWKVSYRVTYYEPILN